MKMGIDIRKDWPPVPGDFEVGDLSSSVAICTLGKKIQVQTRYAIIGTCKTENIGIERVIVNVVSNPLIRYFILAGPEVPGHHTGASMKALYEHGIDEDTRRIREATGAIPFIENIPLEAVSRFREQIKFIDMMNVSDPARIAQKAEELNGETAEPYPEEPIWIDFKSKSKKKKATKMVAPVSLVPEIHLFYHPDTSLVYSQTADAKVTDHPTSIGIEVRESEEGTILVGKES